MTWTDWSTPQSHPERGGLRIVATLDASAYSDFDMFILWIHEETGLYYWGEDSGCSCPAPFEGVESLSDLETGPVGRGLAAASAWAKRDTHHSDSLTLSLPPQLERMRRNVRDIEEKS